MKGIWALTFVNVMKLPIRSSSLNDRFHFFVRYVVSNPLAFSLARVRLAPPLAPPPSNLPAPPSAISTPNTSPPSSSVPSPPLPPNSA